MPDRPLQLAQASITTLSYACPVCERVLEFDSSDLEEDAGGAVAPAGPHRFPRCYECDTQFECAPVQLTTLAAKPASGHRVLVVHWEWTAGPHKGARFWAAHGADIDGRCADWPGYDLRPLGAATVEVKDGACLDLIEAVATATRAHRDV